MADRKKLVLVVDDDRDLLIMFEMLLDACGLEVFLASNGAEALEFMERRIPDLIFLDIRMPVMGGHEFARLFRERHKEKVPIIVITAAVDPQQRAEEVGAEDFLAKPFELNDLLAKIQYYLGTLPPL